MTEQEQKNTIRAFSEYLSKEGVSYFILAYKPNGALTCALNAGEDFPEALAFTMLDDTCNLEAAFSDALAINAMNKGRIVQINGDGYENQN